MANSLSTSQSGVSKHIKDLEDELGVELFLREGKRLLGMTEPGREMVKIVERLLLDAQNIKNLADQHSQQDKGHLVLATTHTQARLWLAHRCRIQRILACERPGPLLQPPGRFQFQSDPEGRSGNFAGQGIDLRVRHNLTPQLLANVGYTHLATGDFVRNRQRAATGCGSADSNFFYFEVTFVLTPYN